jgi:hypothetical protein
MILFLVLKSGSFSVVRCMDPEMNTSVANSKTFSLVRCMDPVMNTSVANSKIV